MQWTKLVRVPRVPRTMAMFEAGTPPPSPGGIQEMSTGLITSPMMSPAPHSPQQSGTTRLTTAFSGEFDRYPYDPQSNTRIPVTLSGEFDRYPQEAQSTDETPVDETPVAPWQEASSKRAGTGAWTGVWVTPPPSPTVTAEALRMVPLKVESFGDLASAVSLGSIGGDDIPSALTRESFTLVGNGPGDGDDNFFVEGDSIEAEALAPIAAAHLDAAAEALATQIDASRARARKADPRHRRLNAEAECESPDERRRRIMERRMESSREQRQASFQARPSGLLPQASPHQSPQGHAPKNGLGTMIRADDDNVRYDLEPGCEPYDGQPNALYEACRKGCVESVKVSAARVWRRDRGGVAGRWIRHLQHDSLC